jgi:hypothetical protein
MKRINYRNELQHREDNDIRGWKSQEYAGAVPMAVVTARDQRRSSPRRRNNSATKWGGGVVPTSMGTRMVVVTRRHRQLRRSRQVYSVYNFNNEILPRTMINMLESDIIQVYFAVWAHDVVLCSLPSSFSSTLIVLSVIRPPGSANAS